MSQEEEIQYWKEKYRILKLSMHTEQKTLQDNQDRMHKFKMVPIIEDLLRFISFDLSKSTAESYEKLKNSQTAVTKWKVNKELGVDYYDLGE
jgi:molecular chaperone GrpE (heat shock protein)